MNKKWIKQPNKKSGKVLTMSWFNLKSANLLELDDFSKIYPDSKKPLQLSKDNIIIEHFETKSDALKYIRKYINRH